CTSHRSASIAIRNHLATSGWVLLASWEPVFAVITTRQSSQVLRAHFASIATRADFPGPFPDTVALKYGVCLVSGFWRCRTICANPSCCHPLAPLAPPSSPPPHEKAEITNPRGSCENPAKYSAISTLLLCIINHLQTKTPKTAVNYMRG